MYENYDEFSFHIYEEKKRVEHCAHKIKNFIFNIIILYFNYTQRKLTWQNIELCMKDMEIRRGETGKNDYK